MSVSAGHRYRFTVDQYHRMGALGVFQPDCRVELLDGEIFEMTPVDPWHAGVVDWLTERFVLALGGRAVVRVQNPIGLDDRSEPQPDLILLEPQRDFYRRAHPGPGHAFLVIEVANTSLRHDRSRKLPLYARADVREVWIVNRSADAIEVFGEPFRRGYRAQRVAGRGEHVAPAAFPDCRFLVDDILG